jgi:hypothetical protein
MTKPAEQTSRRRPRRIKLLHERPRQAPTGRHANPTLAGWLGMTKRPASVGAGKSASGGGGLSKALAVTENAVSKR